MNNNKTSQYTSRDVAKEKLSIFSTLASNKSQRCTYFQPMKFNSNFLLATSLPLSKITADITIVLPRKALKRVLTSYSQARSRLVYPPRFH